jgi:hypothetical protein
MSSRNKDLIGVLFLGAVVLGGFIGAAFLISGHASVFLAGIFEGTSPYGPLIRENIATGLRLFSVFCVVCGIFAAFGLAFPAKIWALADRIRAKFQRYRTSKTCVLCVAVLLVVLSVITYANAFSIGFYSDDFAWIDSTAKTAQNPEHMFSLSQSHFFRPVTFLYHTLNYGLFGGNPHLLHLFGIVLHGLAGVFIFLIGLKLTGRMGFGVTAALLFCVYPVSSRSVMWISGSEIVFAGLIYLVALYLYLLYLDRKRPAFYLLSMVLFIFGLMAKEAVISLAAAAFLAGLLFHKRASRWSGLPFVLIAVAFIFFQMSIQADSFLLETNVYSLNLGVMIQNYGGYSFSSVIPLGHRILELYPFLKGISLAALAVLIPIVLVYGSNLIRFLLLWYLLLLAPFMAFNLPVQPRYLYLPAFALSLLFAWFLWTLYAKAFYLSAYRKMAFAAVFCLVAAAALVQIHTAAVKMRFESIHMKDYIETVKSDPQKMRAIREGKHPADSPLTPDHLKAALKIEHSP